MFETPHCLLFGLPLSLGAFEMGEMHGAGLMTFANGDVYEGSMTRNVMQGAQGLGRKGEEEKGELQPWATLKNWHLTTYALQPGSEGSSAPPPCSVVLVVGKASFNARPPFFAPLAACSPSAGPGTKRFHNGDVYTGEFSANRIRGSGTMVYISGDM